MFGEWRASGVRVVTAEDAFGLLAALPRCVRMSDAEIDRWEATAGVRFAADFRRLLRLAGGSLGWLFPGGLDHPSQIGELRRDAAELFVESGWALGPSDVVVEFLAQGCGMVFLRPAGDETQVFRYWEQGSGPEASGLSLGLYLATALERHLGSRAELGVAPDRRPSS